MKGIECEKYLDIQKRPIWLLKKSLSLQFEYRFLSGRKAKEVGSSIRWARVSVECRNTKSLLPEIPVPLFRNTRTPSLRSFLSVEIIGICKGEYISNQTNNSYPGWGKCLLGMHLI
jgi:hypothetical protein